MACHDFRLSGTAEGQACAAGLAFWPSYAYRLGDHWKLKDIEECKLRGQGWSVGSRELHACRFSPDQLLCGSFPAGLVQQSLQLLRHDLAEAVISLDAL